MKQAIVLSVAVAVAAVVAASGAASSPVTLGGSFFRTFTRSGTDTIACPTNVDGNECGVIQLAGLGPADYVYKYGPTFDPSGQMGCFDIDGWFTVTLQSDGSSITGPLSGVWCKPGRSGDRRGGWNSYGNPFSESDTIAFADGTGQFAGLHGSVDFGQSSAGASWHGRLYGSLVN